MKGAKTILRDRRPAVVFIRRRVRRSYGLRNSFSQRTRASRQKMRPKQNTSE
jgi:hypothetical protein